jgi:hypothetical protein
MIDEINNVFPIAIMLLTETSATETKLLATEENRGVQKMQKSQPTIEFWKPVLETEYSHLFKFLVKYTVTSISDF